MPNRRTFASVAVICALTLPGTAADVLLAAMTAEQIDHWVRRDNRDHRRVAADLRQLAGRWCGPDPPRGR